MTLANDVERKSCYSISSSQNSSKHVKFLLSKLHFYLVNTRMRGKQDIKMVRLCTPGVQFSELSVGL